MTDGPQIRRAGSGDLARLTEIYNHYIVHTPITFDLEEKTVEARADWLAQFKVSGRHQCFVAVDEDERALGWACSGPFRPKAAYAPSVEVSIYLDPQTGGQGLGTALYDRLFAALRDEDVHRALAGVTLPNPASLALHRRFGFQDVGRYSQVGRKFDRYWDVLWMEKAL
ncbi:MAG: N-acetyltransferase family protein [Parvibaculaceae bacterium]|nr:N-acetyltransferase family protein [Kangiella sp.]